MICAECGNVMSQDDIDKGICPFCYQRGTLDNESIAESLTKEWGIDFDTAYAVIKDGQQKFLDRCMFITVDGDVYSAIDEEELRVIMLEHLLSIKEDNSISNIEYVFVDGEPRGIEIDIKFTKQDKND